MGYRLDNLDREILEFKPHIDYVEPEQKPGEIEGVDYLQLEDIQENRAKIKRLANAVNVLAGAVQARVDSKAKDMSIPLDSNVDQDTIQAMKRRFPDSDPTKITYQQYRECKDGLRAHGEGVAKQVLVTPDRLKKARDDVYSKNSKKITPGGYNKENGGFRPELNNTGQIIEPMDLEKVQVDLICILVNYIWKNYIKTALTKLPPPVGPPMNLLPDELCDPGLDYEIPGLLLLGEEPDDLLNGKAAESATEEVLSDSAVVTSKIITSS